MKYLAFIFTLIATPLFAIDEGCAIDSVYSYEARLIDPGGKWSGGVYDGDTIAVEIRLGWGINYVPPSGVRLYGINAPEIRPLRSRQEATESREFLRENLPPVGEWFIVNSPLLGENGKYGRPVLILCVDGVNVNRLMVSSGYAEAKDY